MSTAVLQQSLAKAGCLRASALRNKVFYLFCLLTNEIMKEQEDDDDIVYMDESPDWKNELRFSFTPRLVETRTEQFDDFYDCSALQGEGKFGQVYRCRHKSTGLELAAKYLPVRTARQKQDVESEVSILNRLQHPGIAQLFDTFSGPKHMILVLELVDGGELFERVADDHFILTELAVVMVICQLCEALAYIHSRNVVHLDVKPENIMCVSRRGNQIKLVDFGLAKQYREGLQVRAGTAEFIAPEVVDYNPVVLNTDMWSVGVITYILLSGLSPFLADTELETYANVSKGEWDFESDSFSNVSSIAKDFVTKLLVYDKNKRLSALEALRHQWLDIEAWIPEYLLAKQKLKRYVVKRRWKKCVNAILALKRMGNSLKDIS